MKVWEDFFVLFISEMKSVYVCLSLGRGNGFLLSSPVFNPLLYDPPHLLPIELSPLSADWKHRVLTPGK